MGVLDRFRQVVGLSNKALPVAPAAEERVYVLSDAPNVDISKVVKQLSGTPDDRSLAAQSSIWVARCIQYRVAEIMNTEWSLQDRNDEVIVDHPFVNAYDYLWLARQHDLFARWLAMRMIHGDTFIYKAYRGQTTIPGGLFILNSLNVEIEFQYGVVCYRYNAGETGERTYSSEQVFHDRNENYRSDVRGKSQLDAVMADIDIIRFNRMVLTNWLLEDMKPGGIVSPNPTGQPLDDQTVDKLRKQWRSQAKGPRGGSKLKFMTHSLDYQEFGIPPPESDITDDSKLSICVGLGVDPAVFGAAAIKDPLGANTTLREKRASVARDTVRNDLRYFERYVNKVILPWLSPDDGVTFHWDYSKLDALIEYNTDRTEQNRLGFEAGLYSYNEWRRLERLPDVSTDFFNIPPGRRYVHVDNVAQYVGLEQLNMGLDIPPGSGIQLDSAMQRLALDVPSSTPDEEEGAESSESSDAAQPEGTRSVDQDFLRELRNWERIALKDAPRALKFSEQFIPANVAARIRNELGNVNLEDDVMVKALFRACRDMLSGLKIFDDVLYRGGGVSISEADVNEAHRDVRGLANLHGLLNARIEEEIEDEIEG